MNVVSLIGILQEVDPSNKELRKLILERDYQINSPNQQEDILYLMNWDKEAHGEVFTYKNGSLVAIKGRIETYLNKTVIICESIRYLGFK